MHIHLINHQFIHSVTLYHYQSSPTIIFISPFIQSTVEDGNHWFIGIRGSLVQRISLDAILFPFQHYTIILLDYTWDLQDCIAILIQILTNVQLQENEKEVKGIVVFDTSTSNKRLSASHIIDDCSSGFSLWVCTSITSGRLLLELMLKDCIQLTKIYSLPCHKLKMVITKILIHYSQFFTIELHQTEFEAITVLLSMMM